MSLTKEQKIDILESAIRVASYNPKNQETFREDIKKAFSLMTSLIDRPEAGKKAL